MFLSHAGDGEERETLTDAAEWDDTPKPLHELSPRDLEQKARMGRITTKVLSHLAAERPRRGFQWGVPVLLSKSTDPVWPDPGASIEKRSELEL